MTDPTGLGDPATPGTATPPPKASTPGTASDETHPESSRQVRWATKFWGSATVRLLFVTALLVLVAFILYPKETETPMSSYMKISIVERGKQAFPAIYNIRPNGATDIVSIEVDARGATTIPHVLVAALFPLGYKPSNCPPPGCSESSVSTGQDYWIGNLNFLTSGPHVGYGVVRLTVPARGFGFSLGTVQAQASLPKIQYFGPNPPQTFSINYYFPGLSGYDWSIPTSVQNSARTSWTEEMTPGVVTSPQTVIGTDFAAQRSENYKSFIAGALIGVAGAGFLDVIKKLIHGK